MNKDVSVLIPVYVDSEQGLLWLEECIASAYNQANVYVCNDGSILDPMKVFAKFPKVYIIKENDTNMGVSYTRNKLAFYSHSELILPIDCDDVMAKNAVEILVENWKGVPVYPDIRKFGDEIEDHVFRFFDFDCDVVDKALGLCSVFVLHSKEQWKQLGGWNDKLLLYEDAEYNGRLLKKYCGIHIGHVLLDYRIHSKNRSSVHSDANMRKSILNEIRRVPMACTSCGGKKTVKNPITTSIASRMGVPVSSQRIGDVMTLTESSAKENDGKILARYVGGKGKAKHYYKGQSSKVSYRVLHGELYYVHPEDAKSTDDVGNPRLFVRVGNANVTSKVSDRVATIPQVGVSDRSPKIDPDKHPVSEVVAPSPEADAEEIIDEEYDDEDEDEEDYLDLPDITNMTNKEVFALEDTDPEVLAALLDMEKTGKQREKVINFLNRRLSSVVEEDEEE